MDRSTSRAQRFLLALEADALLLSKSGLTLEANATSQIHLIATKIKRTVLLRLSLNAEGYPELAISPADRPSGAGVELDTPAREG